MWGCKHWRQIKFRLGFEGDRNPPVYSAVWSRGPCGYWAVENGLFRVHDVSYNEDRLHGRKLGSCLSSLRNIAISSIHRQGYSYIPDGWRDIASQRDHGLHLLQRKRLIL